MHARLVVNVNLGNYASALGSAQQQPNGNLVFDSGFARQTIEVLPRGTKSYVLRMNMQGYQYRSYIYSNLYRILPNGLAPGSSTLTSRSIARRQENPAASDEAPPSSSAGDAPGSPRCPTASEPPGRSMSFARRRPAQPPPPRLTLPRS
jgi:hypothetical protein